MKFTCSKEQLAAAIKKVKQSVIGQDDAINKLAVTLVKHYLRNSVDGKFFNIPRASNLLLHGATGCGKTYLIKVFAKELDIPILEINAASLTKHGWSGISFEDTIYMSSDARNCQHSIIYLDEFDKLLSPSSNSAGENVSHEIQGQLLKYIEGAMITVSKSEKIDSSLFLYVFSGAFGKFNDKKALEVGFNSSHQSELDKKDIYQGLIDYGCLPELAGRITSTVGIRKLNEQDYRRIIFSPTFFLNQWNQILICDELYVVLTKENIESMIEYTMKQDLGVRGLLQAAETILDKTLLEALERN